MDTMSQMGNYVFDDEIPAHLLSEGGQTTTSATTSSSTRPTSPMMDDNVRPPDEIRYERLMGGDEPPRGVFGLFGAGGSSTGRSGSSRPVARDWNCTACTLFNAKPAVRCAACDTPAPNDAFGSAGSGAAPAANPAPAAGGQSYGPPAGIHGDRWSCEMCGTEQRAANTMCSACGYHNPHFDRGCSLM